MPAINIRFEQNELDTIRDRAAHEGRSLQSLVHDAAVERASQRDTYEEGMDELDRLISHHKALFDSLATK